MQNRPRERVPSLSLQGGRFKTLDLARGRLALVTCVFLMAYVILALRLVDISIVQHPWGGQSAQQEPQQETIIILAEKSEEKARGQNTHKSGAGPHHRQDIIDRNGVLLARSLEMASLYADPAVIQDVQGTARALHKLFPRDITQAEAIRKLSSKKRFVWIKRHLTPEQMEQVLRIGDPGLAFRTEQRRVYPQGHLAAHLVGYADIDGRGISGVEKGHDSNLTSAEHPLQLSIDVRVQHLLRERIINAVTRHKAKAGAGIIMNVQNGEVLAAVSLPDFDPHSPDRYDGEHLFNRFSLGVYELGSTFKIFSTAAYLDADGRDIFDAFDTREPIRNGGFTIRDYHGKKAILSLPEVFIYSSNIGSAKMGEVIGTSGMRSLFDDLALSDRLDIAVPERGQPLLPEPWRDIHTLTASYGHGVAVTPLHFTAAAASVAYRGEFVPPRLNVFAGKDEEDSLQYSVVSADTASDMRRLLRLVVTHGTGSLADVPGYMVGGKTGTAEKPGNGGYDAKRLISSFFGMFPMDDPKYAIFVMVDEPQGIPETFGYATGGWVAAPVVGDVISGMGRILGLPKRLYEDEKFLAGLDQTIRSEKELKQNKVQSSDKPGRDTPPQIQYGQEAKLVSY